LREREVIQTARRQAGTSCITRKNTELTERHVSAEADDRFAREISTSPGPPEDAEGDRPH
jgi:hypothetical protein